MRWVLVDRITLLDPPKRARGEKRVPIDHAVFADHFPTSPLWPGALILESLAQLAGALLDEAAREAGRGEALSLLAVVHRAKFRRAVRPGDLLALDVETLAWDEERSSVRAVASVGGEPVADAELAFAYLTGHDPALIAARRRQVAAWREGGTA